MVTHGSQDGETAAATPASNSSDQGIRKFTLSCSRCRASKLKCDRNEPCMECVKRNIGHLCTKDERQPRVKRAKVEHNGESGRSSGSQNPEPEAEEATQLLEYFVDGTARSANPSVVMDTSLAFVAPDHFNSYWSTIGDPQRHAERQALIREIVDAMPELEIIHMLYGVFVTRCQGPLGNVIHTPTFMMQADKFSSCLALASPEARAMALSGSIPMDVLACQLLALVLSLAFHPSPSLLGWAPSTLTLRVEELRVTDVHSRTWRSLALRCLQGGASLFCGSIPSLQAATMLLLDAQEGWLSLDAILVTAISGAQKLGLHRLGQATLDPPSSPISSADMAASPPAHIRTETGVRIWWALVMRDWSRALALGYYTVRPGQFNTRMPLHLNDEDLNFTSLRIDGNGHIIERPRSEFTMLSYTVLALEISTLARESVDLRDPMKEVSAKNEKSAEAKARTHAINKKYESFVAGLPAYFRLGSSMGLASTGPMAAIPVQRWMLHQQLWSLFLRIYRSNFASQEGRASCHLLAQNIISTQSQIQARCAVCGTLSTSETQLFNAAVVMLIDLLFTARLKDTDRAGSQLTRLMTKDKIQEAVDLLKARAERDGSPPPPDPQSERAKASAQRSVIALEALMKLEEAEFSSPENTPAPSPVGGRRGSKSPGSASKLLKTKVIDILEALQGNSKSVTAEGEQAFLNSFSTLDMSAVFSNPAEGFHDFDVLPVVSNDPSSNFWQFLEFGAPPPALMSDNDPFAATADLQTLIGPMPLISGSSDGFPTPDFADMYSNSDSTFMTQHSLSSIETGNTDYSGASDTMTTMTTPSIADAYVAAKFNSVLQ